MRDNTKIKITAIGSIALLETLALYKGIDGVLFSMVIAVIAGLAGYQIRNIWERRKEEWSIIEERRE